MPDTKPNYWKWAALIFLAALVIYVCIDLFYGKPQNSEKYFQLEQKYSDLEQKVSTIEKNQAAAHDESVAAQKHSDSLVKSFLNEKPINYKEQYEKAISTYRTNTLSQNQRMVSAWLHREYRH